MGKAFSAKKYRAPQSAIDRFLDGKPTAPQAGDNGSPLLSIVVPSLNQCGFLERTLLSILNQSFRDFEIIVMDGGSTDGSKEILERYSHYIKYWESVADNGQAHAINKGFRRARGRYVAWQNSDDVYMPNAFQEFADVIIAESPNVICANIFLTDSNLRIFGEVRYTPIDVCCLPSVKASIANQAAFFMRENLEKAGYLDESFRYCLDFDLWSRLLVYGPSKVIRKNLGIYVWHDQSKTAKLDDVHRSERALVISELVARGGAMDTWTARAVCRMRKAIQHVAQGDISYLRLKIIHRLTGARGWEPDPSPSK